VCFGPPWAGTCPRKNARARKRTNTANTANRAFALPPKPCENHCVCMQHNLQHQKWNVCGSKARRRPGASVEGTEFHPAPLASRPRTADYALWTAPARDYWIQNVDCLPRRSLGVGGQAHSSLIKPNKPISSEKYKPTPCPAPVHKRGGDGFVPPSLRRAGGRSGDEAVPAPFVNGSWSRWTGRDLCLTEQRAMD